VPLRLPYTTLDIKRNYLKLVQYIAQKADHIITVSESSKQDIMTMLGVPEERVTNCYQSVHIPPSVLAKDEAQISREVEGVIGVGYKNYFLFWGAIEPKKNIARMIEAYLSSGVQTPLVMVGARAWKSKHELALLGLTRGDDERSPRGIIKLPYAPFGLLMSLIRGAKAALFPSLYEGFGLPALEGMLLGTPVICSNTASLPELVDNAALTVDPYDVAALARAIRDMDADADLRAVYASAGPDRAARFNADAYRARLKSVYDRFL